MSRFPFLRVVHHSLLVLALLAATSCGRKATPTAPTAASGITATGAPTSGFTQGPNGPVVDGEAIVSLVAGVDAGHFLEIHDLDQIGAPLTLNGRTWLRVRSDDPALKADLAGHLQLEQNVDLAVPNSYIKTSEKYGEPMAEDGGEPSGEPMAEDGGDGFREGRDYLEQLAVAQIELQEAHRFATGSGVNIAILDTGIDSTPHEAFAGALLEIGNDHTQTPPQPGSYETQDGVDSDHDGWKHEAFGHGTHIAGIVHLAAPGAKLIIIKVLDDDGWGHVWGIAEAIREAVDLHGAQVINLSLGMYEEDEFLHDAIQYAASHDVVVAACAGNGKNGLPQYPAAWPEVLSVTAVNESDVLADFASYGGTVDLTAPGVDIVSAIPANAQIGEYAIASGGSMATAWVSAAAALVIQTTGPVYYRAVQEQIRYSSVPINDLNPGRAGQIGNGRLNLLGAVTYDPEPIFP